MSPKKRSITSNKVSSKKPLPTREKRSVDTPDDNNSVILELEKEAEDVPQDDEETSINTKYNALHSYWEPKRQRVIAAEEIDQLQAECEDVLRSMSADIEHATDLAQRAGLPTSSTLTRLINHGPTVTTGGHSNTDHVIIWTGDALTDRLEELKRNYATRLRDKQAEKKGTERWDKPRIPGGRRRRIVRDVDAPDAPMEPPKSGYIMFLGQMTCKYRHDRPNEPHNQTAIVQDVSKLWRIHLTEGERVYYNEFADSVVAEYHSQQLEFKATGTYTPSERYGKVQGVGPWIHLDKSEQNSLEQEISTYDTVVFPMRPVELEKTNDVMQRLSKVKRKLKLKGLLDDSGVPKAAEDDTEGTNIESLAQNTAASATPQIDIHDNGTAAELVITKDNTNDVADVKV